MFTQDKIFEADHLSVMVDATNRCQLGCTYCYFGEKKQEDMDLEKVQTTLSRFISLFPNLKDLNVHFMGGEPLLAWDKVVPFITQQREQTQEKEVGFVWGLTSNLVGLDAEKTEFMIKNKGEIHCSIDGPAEIHNANRPFRNSGKGSYDEVVRNVRNALSITPHDTARVTVCPSAAGFCATIADSVLGLGFEYVGIFPATGHSVVWTTEAIRDFARSFSQAYKNSPVYENGRGRAVRGIIRTPALPKDREFFSHCGAGKSLWAIDVGGRLYHCHHFTNISEMHIASVLDTPEQIRQKVLDSTLAPFARVAPIPESCRACPAFDFCNGGCWAENFLSTGDSRYQTDPVCSLMIGLASELGDIIRIEEPFYREGHKRQACTYCYHCQECDRCDESCVTGYCGSCEENCQKCDTCQSTCKICESCNHSCESRCEHYCQNCDECQCCDDRCYKDRVPYGCYD